MLVAIKCLAGMSRHARQHTDQVISAVRWPSDASQYRPGSYPCGWHMCALGQALLPPTHLPGLIPRRSCNVYPSTMPRYGNLIATPPPPAVVLPGPPPLFAVSRAGVTKLVSGSAAQKKHNMTGLVCTSSTGWIWSKCTGRSGHMVRLWKVEACSRAERETRCPS